MPTTINGYAIEPYANLTSADLRGADLRRANLIGADLTSADLIGADLRGANLIGADLRDANLTSANLRDANLTNANLRGADLTDAKLPHYQRLPSHGAFTVWKQLGGALIAELLVPAEAARVSALVGHKCRVAFAEVVAITSIDGLREYSRGVSANYPSFYYVVGNTVTPTEPFNDDIRVECASGIHCYPVRQEAVDHA